jgi:hypothetical protein
MGSQTELRSYPVLAKAHDTGASIMLLQALTHDPLGHNQIHSLQNFCGLSVKAPVFPTIIRLLCESGFK